MDKVRIGIIGFGVIGSMHSRYLAGKEVPNAELTAICDNDPEKLKLAQKAYGEKVKLFDDADKLLASGEIDGVLIATPHYDHPTLAIKAFQKGIHVLSEKPAGVYTKQVKEMYDVYADSPLKFSMMYNQRTNPLYQKVRDLIKSGELGEIKRSVWIITSWYRPQSYFNSGGWRATWAGEGGGVLLNQCPHQLDIWQWICGMPVRVRAFCEFGKYHDIEVEDDVTAYVEYTNGATGVFITTTGEAPGTNRLEISGDMGKLVVEEEKLTFWRSRVSERQFNKEFKGNFGSPEVWKCDIPVKGTETGHKGITANWVEAILKGTPLLAPGVEGINVLQISNAMLLSAWTGNTIDIPIDDELFYEKLKEKINTSKYKK